MLAVERHADPNTSVIFYTLSTLFIRVFLRSPLVGFPLDHQTTTTSRYQALEDRRKLFRDLLESALNSFVLALIKDLNKLLNGCLGVIEFLPTLGERVTLGGEVVVLLKGLLIDVFVLLESLGNLAKTGLDLGVLSCGTR